MLEAVGGKDNVTNVIHCMTRLRFTLKDTGIPDPDKIRKIRGVIDSQMAGTQFQAIIGQNVGKVYDELCDLGGFKKQAGIDENLDAPKEKLVPKVIWRNVLDYVSGSTVALIPILMAGGLFRCIGTVIGPSVLNLVGTDDPTYLLFYTYLFDAAMYFLPIYLGYSAAKKIGATPVLGMLMGGILISPEIVSLAKDGGSLLVYGVSIAAANYSQTVLPVLLSVAALYFVEKLFKRILPEVLYTVFGPFLTMAVMVPLAFIVLAPLGNLMGGALSMALYGIADAGSVGYLAAMFIVGGLWQLFVITGMHIAIIMPALVSFMQVGEDSFLFVATNVAMFGVWGMILGAALRMRKSVRSPSATWSLRSWAASPSRRSSASSCGSAAPFPA